jgi:hypothetical protein
MKELFLANVVIFGVTDQRIGVPCRQAKRYEQGKLLELVGASNLEAD